MTVGSSSEFLGYRWSQHLPKYLSLHDFRDIKALVTACFPLTHSPSAVHVLHVPALKITLSLEPTQQKWLMMTLRLRRLLCAKFGTASALRQTLMLPFALLQITANAWQ
jgi:hypothetical protein